MKCVYILDGLKPMTELELDEYLLTMKELHAPDVVLSEGHAFGKTAVFNRNKKLSPILFHNDLVIRNINAEAERLIQENKTKKPIEVNPYSEGVDDPIITDETKGYVGVTTFMLLLKNIAGGKPDNPVFPLFDMENYEKKIIPYLKELVSGNNGKGWIDQEIDIGNGQMKVFFPSDFVNLLFGKDQNGEQIPPKDIPEDQWEMYKDRLKFIWNLQAVIGSEIHAVLSYFLRHHFGTKSSDIIDKIIDGDNGNKTLKELREKFEYLNDDNLLISTLLVAQQLSDLIVERYKGRNPIVYSEVKVKGDCRVGDNELGLLGVIDLLILDDKGNVEIVDFKCSPKLYSMYDPAKSRTFRYQLAIYRRMLKLLGLISEKTSYNITVIPITFANFAYHTYDEKVTFSDVQFGTQRSESIFKDLEDDPKLNITASDRQIIEENISAYVKDVRFEDLKKTSVLLTTEDFVKKVFPKYGEFVNATEAELFERVIEFVQRRGGLIKKEEGTGFIFIDKNENKTYEGKTEDEVYNKIKEKWLLARGTGAELAENIGSSLLDAQTMKKGWDYKGTGRLKDVETSSKEWTSKFLSKYATPEWRVVTYGDMYPFSVDSKENIKESPLMALQSLGIILLENKQTKQIDVLRFTNSELEEGLYLGGTKRRRFLLGTFLDDDVQRRDTGSLVLESVRGNIMLMETMAALNCFGDYFSKENRMLGNITVVNPSGRKTMGGLSASNKQLLYNFSRLSLFAKTQNNFYRDHGKGYIKMMTYAELVLQQIRSILSMDRSLLHTRLRSFEDNDEIEQFVQYDLIMTNQEKVKEKLLELKETMEVIFPSLKGAINKELPTFEDSQELEVYHNLLLAIAEQNNMDIVLQLNNNPRFFSSLYDSLINGVNGSYSDNPGMLKSSNLNMMATATERGYQNVRVAVTQFNNQLQEKIRKLKEKKGFGRLTKYTVGNQSKLYENLYDKDQMKLGRYQFKNPWSNESNLTAEERDVLIFAIQRLAIENTRFGSQLVDENGKFKENVFFEKFAEDPDEFLKVPLIRGDFASIITQSGGLLNAIRNYFKQFLPTGFSAKEWSKFHTHISNKIYEFLDVKDKSGENIKSKAKNGNIYEMINRVKNSYDDELRDRLLTETDDKGNKHSRIQYYESNLEKILLSSNVAYNILNEMNKIFPIMKAVVIGLTFLGFIQNQKFTNDISYVLDYIKNKILGLPLEDIESWSTLRTIATELASSTSKLALAFNPVQLYQTIDGLWKDIMLVILKPDMNPDNISAFSAKNMRDSFLWIIQDVAHFSDIPSLGEAFNRMYGINDMDINTYQHNISTDNAGIFNFWKVGFRFSSRPDYYNRLTIFGALLRELGAWKAHSRDANGNLIYDWTLDERFDRYAKGDKSNIELYNKLKAMYLTMAREFVLEGAIMPDGTKFVIGTDEKPTPLPRALTTRESEGLKALGDKIYGYYAHEKRSMILSYTLGALFMQMHTYWSSKKNQWLSGHVFSQQGEYRQYSELRPDENGKLTEVLYWMDDKGEPTDENTGVPFLVWKGRPQEGIWVTLINLSRDLFRGVRNENGEIERDENGNLMVGWQYMMTKNFIGPDVDPYKRNLYRANLHQLWYDLLMLLLLGSLIAPALKSAANKRIKDSGNEYISDAFFNTSILIGTKMLVNSAEDFNMINSIFGQFADWTPFSIGMFTRQTSNLYELLTGDRDIYDAIIKTTSATRNTQPLWDHVKLNTLGYGVGKKKPE